ncbi:MAG: hypothetical protein RL264_2084 [Bacteroidota bacterium]|jgi:cytochrome c peroxidase
MKLIYFLFLGIVVISCKKKDQPFVITYPEYFPSPVYQFIDNTPTKSRFELGRKLFYDPILSEDNTVSCATCHAQTHGFADHGVSFSQGVHGLLGNRNAPTVFNLLWSPYFNWDGGVNHLEIFSLAPITNPVEMNESIENVLLKLNNTKVYRDAFKFAYGTEEITDQLMYRAISIFLAVIVSDGSKYDDFRQGKVSFTDEENAGYQLFKNNCASCHSEPLFTNFSFQNNGLDSVFVDLGRARITQESSDIGKFKVPTLRNIELTYPYMHDGRFMTLNMVLNHYDSGIKHSPTLSSSLSQGIHFTSQERASLIAFLKTLTDYKLLDNAKFRE